MNPTTETEFRLVQHPDGGWFIIVVMGPVGGPQFTLSNRLSAAEVVQLKKALEQIP